MLSNIELKLNTYNRYILYEDAMRLSGDIEYIVQLFSHRDFVHIEPDAMFWEISHYKICDENYDKIASIPVQSIPRQNIEPSPMEHVPYGFYIAFGNYELSQRLSRDLFILSHLKTMVSNTKYRSIHTISFGESPEYNITEGSKGQKHMRYTTKDIDQLLNQYSHLMEKNN